MGLLKLPQGQGGSQAADLLNRYSVLFVYLFQIKEAANHKTKTFLSRSNKKKLLRL
jgi:hypothetical protein